MRNKYLVIFIAWLAFMFAETILVYAMSFFSSPIDAQFFRSIATDEDMERASLTIESGYAIMQLLASFLAFQLAASILIKYITNRSTTDATR